MFFALNANDITCIIAPSQVVYANRFSEGGASQLLFDINKAISPLLAQYTSTDSNSLMKQLVR